jgi:hypothetical protein
MAQTYGVTEDRLVEIACPRAARRIAIDGDLTKSAWRDAVRSPRFVDMVSGEPALYQTRVACQWDAERFYVAYWVEEPQVRATLTQRDSFVWNDNDVELFVAGDDCYYELEINAFGTVYEALFVWQDALVRGGRFDRAGFDLYSGHVDMLGGFQDASRWGRHPRGRRFAFLDFDLAGLETAVRIDGRINDPATTDRGWTVEMALPWSSLARLFDGRAFPPAEGETLRCDFSRFEALRVHGKPLPEHPGWSLNPHGVYDSHIPESFSIVRFVR